MGGFCGLCRSDSGVGDSKLGKSGTVSAHLGARQKGITELANGPKRDFTNLKLASEEDFPAIIKGLSRVLVFARLEPDVVQQVASQMYVLEVKKDDVLIREGDEGDDEMFVVKSGLFHVTEEHHGAQVRVNQKVAGDVFGELALMYGAARSATVVAVEDCVVYTLQRQVFRKYVREAAQAEMSERDVFLNSVPILSSVMMEERFRLAEALQESSYKPGQTVVRQGEEGNHFYIVMKGEAVVMEKQSGKGVQKINHLFRSDFFGERALFTNEPRMATVTAAGDVDLKVLQLHRDAFTQLLGPLQQLMERAKSEHVVNRRMSELAGQQVWATAAITLTATRMLAAKPGSRDLKANKVDIKCSGRIASSLFNVDDPSYNPDKPFSVNLTEGHLLGGGASSMVHLCTDQKTGKTFALKRMRKVSVMSTPDHIFCEQAITKTLAHPYCMRQHAAFQDQSSLYLLFDYLDGCDLMDTLAGMAVVRLLRPPGRPFAQKVKVLQGMTEDTARYYIGSMILAFEYIHSSFIVYRDLKPENVLVDKDGYPKLGDFGFAKNLEKAGGRTYTFCGTPGYVAPEVVLARGYGTAVDWWGLGVMSFVLLSGQQPFSRTVSGVPDDPLTVMKRIVDPNWTITFPWYMSENAQDFILRLLQRRPSKRLGNMANRAEDLKRHPWFAGAGFDWDKLEAKKLPPPPVVLKGELKNAQKKRLAELEQDLARIPDDIDKEDPELKAAKAVFAEFGS